VSGVGNIVSIVNTEIDANQNFAIQANGSNTVLGVANSVLNASPAGINLITGIAVSIGPSNVLSGTDAFTSTQPFK
jgi:hypothetical protein